VLEHPIRAAGGRFEAARCAVAGTMYAVAEKKIDLGDDARHVDTGEVADTSAVIGGLEVREVVLGDLPFADGVVGVAVAGGEDVDVVVGIVVLITDSEAFEGGAENSGAQKECGEEGGGWEMHFGLDWCI